MPESMHITSCSRDSRETLKYGTFGRKKFGFRAMSRRILKLFVASLLNILYFPVIQAIYDISSTSQIAKGRYKFGFAISVSPEKDNVAKLINLKSYRRVPFQPVIEELAGKENIELNNILFASPVCHFAKESMYEANIFP